MYARDAAVLTAALLSAGYALLEMIPLQHRWQVLGRIAGVLLWTAAWCTTGGNAKFAFVAAGVVGLATVSVAPASRTWWLRWLGRRVHTPFRNPDLIKLIDSVREDHADFSVVHHAVTLVGVPDRRLVRFFTSSGEDLLRMLVDRVASIPAAEAFVKRSASGDDPEQARLVLLGHTHLVARNIALCAGYKEGLRLPEESWALVMGPGQQVDFVLPQSGRWSDFRAFVAPLREEGEVVLAPAPADWVKVTVQRLDPRD